MSATSSDAERLVETIVRHLNHDPATCRRDPDRPGLSFIPGDFAARVSAIVQDGDNHVRLQVRTEAIRGFRPNDLDLVQRACLTSHLWTSCYGWVHLPPGLVPDENLRDDLRHLNFGATYYARTDDEFGLRFFALIAAIAIADAQIKADGLAESLGAGISPNRSREVDVFHPILHVIEELRSGEQSEVGKWIGSPEFDEIIAIHGRAETSFGFSMYEGLTLETPFVDRSVLHRVYADQIHPQLGPGLLVTSQLPLFDDVRAVSSLCAQLSFGEAMEWTGFPQIGSWSARKQDSGAYTPTHATFLPNAFYVPGLAHQMVLWSMERAAWVKARLFPDQQDLPLYEILENRIDRLGLRDK